MIYNESKYNENWKTMKLSDLGEFARGKSKHRPRNDKCLFEGGGYPLVQTGEIKEANLYITHGYCNHTLHGDNPRWKPNSIFLTNIFFRHLKKCRLT